MFMFSIEGNLIVKQLVLSSYLEENLNLRNKKLLSKPEPYSPIPRAEIDVLKVLLNPNFP